MSWATYPDRQLAEQVCTPKQLNVLQRHARGMSIRTIAYTLDIAPSTVREHLDAADRRIRKAKKEAA